MIDFGNVKYNTCKAWIRSKKENHFSWIQIKNCCVDEEYVAEEFAKLKIPAMVIPMDMQYEEWVALVDEIAENYIDVMGDNVNGIYANSNLVEYIVPSGSHDAWVQYEKKLRGELDGKRRMSNASIKNIKENSHWILNRIRKDTREYGPQKGLVMGSVQSGKTASMIGLVTMAAHYDWNFIIILSGTVDNLRVQTRNRFMLDLGRCQDADWHFLESTSDEDLLKDIKENKKISIREANFNFSEPNTVGRLPHRETYVMICLKQASRLRKLIHWLHSDPNVASRLRLLIIDDEADQASINTAKMTESEIQNRTAINMLIGNLANGVDEDGTVMKFQALNYIAFTATPYANVLNEPPHKKESLYPKDFVMCLPENNSYFGSKVIWGSKNDEKFPGLDIVREIGSASSKIINEIGKGTYHPFPEEFKDAIAWFFCCVAALRSKNWSKPISMLIHTATGNQAHFNIYEALKLWIDTDRENGQLISRCQRVYEGETSRFTIDSFKEGYSTYEDIERVDGEYPDFADILTELISLLEEEPQKIEIVADGKLEYSEKGIHICVDNCRAKKYADDDETQLRIVYPDDEALKKMSKAPAFIVIGGSTLSRGLTIEGLVSTFFSRNSNQADSLMQMARWYGYRKGYELYPRIWMTEKSIEKFRLLERVDEKLRKTLNDYKEMGKDPGKIFPSVMSTSAIARFLLTSKNKSQFMVPCAMDFSGDSYEVTEFSSELEVIKNNVKITCNFLRTLGEAQLSKVYPDRSVVWRKVNSTATLQYLKDFCLYQDSKFRLQMKDFFSWIEKENEKGHYLFWNVAVCGASTYKGEKWVVEGIDYPLGKVERTKLCKVTTHIDIGSMRSGSDGICDVEVASDSVLLEEGKKGKNIEVIRGKLGYSDVPLLLIYCICGNGGTDKAGSRRKLGIETSDLIGYSVIIGGEMSNTDHVEEVVVGVPKEEEDEADE